MEPAPFFPALAHGPEGGAAYWTRAEDDLRLRLGHFPSKGPAKGTVLLFPGRTEYVEKYGVTAAGLAPAGYHTLAVDWRGQGLADRMHPDPCAGHVQDFDDYQKDVSAVLAAARTLGLPEPYHLLSHSMGGCIGLRALLNGLPVASAAFSAPMWGIVIEPSLRPAAWIVTSLVRRTPLARNYAPGTAQQHYVLFNPFEDNTLTTDAEMFDRMRHQLTQEPDLAIGGPTLRWLNEALIEMRVLSKLPSPELPALCGLGSNERIVSAERIEARMAAWPQGKLVHYDGAEHELMVERPEVRDGWLSEAIALFDRVGAGDQSRMA